MLEPRATARRQKTVYHTRLSWLGRRAASTEKGILIHVHPTGLQSLLPPSSILSPMVWPLNSELLMSDLPHGESLTTVVHEDPWFELYLLCLLSGYLEHIPFSSLGFRFLICKLRIINKPTPIRMLE